MLTILFILGLVIFFGGLLSCYNSLVSIRKRCAADRAAVEAELRRRHDLISRLADVVRGYPAHDRGLLDEVTRLREACASNAGSLEGQCAAENDLATNLKKLMTGLEAYPESTADNNFLALREELIQTEAKLFAAQRDYNENVRSNNELVQAFPTNHIATVFGFKKFEPFELKDV